MIQGFLLVLLTGVAWALPPQLDDAMIILGQSDSYLNEFFEALAHKSFKKLPDLYNKVTAAVPNLEKAVDQLQKTHLPKNLQVIVRLLNIQLNTVIYKIRGIIPNSDQNQGNEQGIVFLQKDGASSIPTLPAVFPKDIPASFDASDELGNDILPGTKLHTPIKSFGQRIVHRHYKSLI